MQLADELISPDQLLAVQVTAPLGETLILKLDRGRSGPFIRAHGTHDMQR